MDFWGSGVSGDQIVSLSYGSESIGCSQVDLREFSKVMAMEGRIFVLLEAKKPLPHLIHSSY